MGSDFDDLATQVRPRLARAFAAAYGVERGEEALAEAMAYAWEHFDRVREMENPAGYLFRVGQSRSKPRPSRDARFPAPEDVGLPDVEPMLPAALERLTERQRVCVGLVYAYGYTFQEVAEVLDISRSSVQSHVDRALESLRASIGVTR